MNLRRVQFWLPLSWAFLLLLNAASSLAAAQDNCNASYVLKPLDGSVLTLLGEGVTPSRQSIFVDPRLRQLQALDFPSKVTAWTERPTPAEMASRRAALVASSGGGNGPATLQPYSLRALSPKDFADLEKWFAKEAPKKVQALCIDPANAAYVLAIGIIADGSAAGGSGDSLAHTQYDQSVTRQSDAPVGPNAPTVTPGGSSRPADELSGMSSGASSGTHTCVYLYRTNSPGGTRRETPEYYYCNDSDSMPKSAVTTMLKFISKTSGK